MEVTEIVANRIRTWGVSVLKIKENWDIAVLAATDEVFMKTGSRNVRIYRLVEQQIWHNL